MATTVTKQSEREQKITTFLMFEKDAVKAVDYYVSVFENARVLGKIPGPDGKEMGAEFELDGVKFAAYNGGPYFKFEMGMSLMVNVETQEETDRLYDTLSEGGEKLDCGWLKDKYGVFWQITPRYLMESLSDPDRAKADRVTQAMMKMKKIDIQALKDAADAA